MNEDIPSVVDVCYVRLGMPCTLKAPPAELDIIRGIDSPTEELEPVELAEEAYALSESPDLALSRRDIFERVDFSS